MGRKLFYNIFFSALLAFGAHASADPLDSGAAVSVYVYFNVGDSGADSSMSYDQFSQQIEEIGIGNYTVLSLNDMLAKEDRGESLPPNSISITFDEPDAETYSRAIPLLIKNKIPFAVFISPGNADDTEWETLKNLSQNNLVTIGLSSQTYGHLGSWDEEKITADLNTARGIFRDKLGFEPEYFAYPLGEYSQNFVNAVSRQGFRAAFGQNSGVVIKSADRMRLPRFTMTEDFGDLDRFRTTSNAMAFPVTDMQPSVSYVTAMPSVGFTIDRQISEDDMKKTKCFASGDLQPSTNYLGSGRVEVRFETTPVTDRLRINCTIPVPGEFEEDDPRYRWLGFLLYFPQVAETQKQDADAMEISPVQP